MRSVPLARLFAAALVFHSLPAAADEVVLDLDAAIARAEAAPRVVAARGRAAEATAARAGATVRFADNPSLEVEAGPRFGAERTVDVSVRIGQTFGIGGHRGARRAVADAEVARAEADADATARDVRLDAALAFLDALHATRVVEAARAAEELARRAADVAERRRAAGDLTDLDAGLARAAAGRARSAVSAAEAELADAVGRLAPLVGLAPDDTVVLRGDLRPDAPLALADLAAGVPGRADLRALDAEGRVAAAEARLARAGARPDLGLWVGYEREEGADVVLGGLSITLPVWNRAQGARAVTRARAARVAVEADVSRRAASREVRDAFAAYEHARVAVETFEAEVLPVLDDGEALLGKSVDAGTIAVADYLVARQELLDGRREYLELSRALARARVTALFAAGVTP